MAEIRPSRILDVSSNTQNNEQQYVEIGSNTYLGTKDGIKYNLIPASDNKIRLVEVPSDSSISLSDSNGSFETSSVYESSSVSNITWSESLSEANDIKVISVKSEPSPCKGQGDEIGNIVLSPLKTVSSFMNPDLAIADKAKQGLTPERLNNSSVLTYASLYPKQDKEQLVTYYVNPSSPYNSYSPVFPSPVAIRPARYPRKPRMPFMSPTSPYTPRVRRGAPRMRRPRQPLYQYTPQILHSTPTNAARGNYNNFSVTLSSGSSGSLSDSTLSKSDSSFEIPRVPNNTPTSSQSDSSDNKKAFSLQWMPYLENYVSLNPREIHNEKERYRRLRIKNSCQAMRVLMPWVDDKTDNARIFEEVVNFIAFVRGMVGCEYDIEFMEKNITF